jgi:hypothetical protein
MLRVPLLQKFIQWLTETSEEPLDRSYLFLRTGIGIVGVALPIVLIFGRMLLERQFGILDSMSAYYTSVMRDVFVGSLWAIGIFLICYRYEHLDDLASTIAGAAVIFVAIFPNPPVHQVSAACFFVILALMALFLFSRTDQENPEGRKQLRNIVYLGCGSFIVLCLVLIVLLNYLPGTSWLQPHHPLFWLEVLALEAFGVAWFVKGGMFILKDKQKDVVTSKNETIPTVEQGVPATDTPQEQERSATSERITSPSILL